MTQPNHPQQPDYFGGPEWPSESHAQGGFDQFGQPVTAHPYQAPDPYSNHSDPSGEDHRRPHVDFGRAVKLFFKNYAVFNGRASRSEYWWIFLFSILVEMILNAINFAMDGTPNDPARLYAVLSTIWFLGTVLGYSHPLNRDRCAPPARHQPHRLVAAHLPHPGHWLDLGAGLPRPGFRRECVAVLRQGAAARHRVTLQSPDIRKGPNTLFGPLSRTSVLGFLRLLLADSRGRRQDRQGAPARLEAWSPPTARRHCESPRCP